MRLDEKHIIYHSLSSTSSGRPTALSSGQPSAFGAPSAPPRHPFHPFSGSYRSARMALSFFLPSKRSTYRSA